MGKGQKPVEAIGAQQRAIRREWGALETVTDMWNVQKRVKIYQKHKQQQHCASMGGARKVVEIMESQGNWLLDSCRICDVSGSQSRSWTY